jgi:hypothetical protein
MCIEPISSIALPAAALIVALFALYYSYSSRHYAEKAVGLALFQRRYNIYYELKLLLNQLLTVEVNSLHERLSKVKYLLWEAQYIYGSDVYELFENLKKAVSATILYYSVADEMADGKQKEDLDVIHKYKLEGYDVLHSLPAELLSDNNSKNLNHYFRKYLDDDAFKKAL